MGAMTLCAKSLEPWGIYAGTPAKRIKDRSKKLLELNDKLYQKYANRFIGQDVTVLIEKYDEKQQAFIGHTSNYLEVKILKESRVGEYKTVKLQKSMIQS